MRRIIPVHWEAEIPPVLGGGVGRVCTHRSHERALECAVAEARRGTAAVTEETIGRGAAALCSFIFPGLFVPRHAMAEAVLAAAVDDRDDWLDHLPPKLVIGAGVPAPPRNSATRRARARRC